MQFIKIVMLLLLKIILFFCANSQSSSLQTYRIIKSYGIQYQHPLSLTPPTISSSLSYIPALLTDKQKTTPTWSFAWHYQQQLGFFCKMEHKLEYQTKFPVKFRLGEVNYVDVLEGKRNATFYQYIP